DLPLLGIHHVGSDTFDLIAQASVRHMNGYLGSVAISKDGDYIATTSPRAGVIQEFRHTVLANEISIGDVCGVAASETGFFLTTGRGLVRPSSGQAVSYDLAWDNHLIAI
ncbi:MAG: DUF1513 domain-containing protein, partial [Pseudomonadota bacterium]